MIRRIPRRAWTLTELLIVVAILGVLMLILLPAIQMVRERANRLQCQGNLRQIGIALHNYHDTYGKFPTAMLDDPKFVLTSQKRPKYPWLSWRAYICRTFPKTRCGRRRKRRSKRTGSPGTIRRTRVWTMP